MRKQVIPLVDLRAQYAGIRADIDTAIRSVVSTSAFIQGPPVVEFERAFAEYQEVGYCIGVNSGTDALTLGLRALGITAGDEVIVPANTFIATALAVTANGAKPVFADIDDTYGMSLTDLERKITSRTRAVIAVHLFGRSDDLDGIRRIVRKSGKRILLIEDACQAHGARYGSRRVGGFGVMAAFSFYPGKNLGAYGDAGAIVTDSVRLAGKLRKLREYGQRRKYEHDSLGVNSRLDSLQAAVLMVKLRKLDTWNRQRAVIAARYGKLLSEQVPAVSPWQEVQGRESVYHLYVIRTPRRSALFTHLTGLGIGVQIHYPQPLHLQKAFAYLGYRNGDLPTAERLSRVILSLPMYPELTAVQQDRIVAALADFFNRRL